MRTNMKFWPAKRMLCLALCILMLVGIAMPSSDAIALDSRESLLGRLFGVSEAYAAENDVTTWTASGTCEWGIDPDGCLWIRPVNGVSGTLSNWGMNNPPWDSKLASIESVVIKPGVSAITCFCMFYNMTNCTSMALSGLDTSNVTRMDSMFNGCSSLTNLDLSGLETSKVTNMSGMFFNCSSLTSLDVSNFDTSNVTNMRNMFSDCYAITSLDVSEFDTSNVTNMDGMFSSCYVLTRLDVSGWDTSNVTNMSNMFRSCSKLWEIKLGVKFAFNGKNISSTSYKAILPTPPSSTTTGKWILEGDELGTSAMTSAQMRDAGTVTPGTWVWEKLPIAILYSNGDLVFCEAYDPIDETKGPIVKTYDGFIKNAAAYNYDSVPWYSACSNIHEVYFNCPITPRGTAYWFYGCNNLTAIHNIENLNTSNATSMHCMFSNCSKLTSLDVSSFDTSNVTDMGAMFSNCSLLTSLDVSRFDTSNVTDMMSMFRSCEALTSLDVSGWNTSMVEAYGMKDMFYGCKALTSLDVSNFDTSNVESMENMFRDCIALTSLDISGFDTSNVTNMQGMFQGSSLLNTIKLGENFIFSGKNISDQWMKALLPTPPSTTTTGKWILEDDVDGGSAMTPNQMQNAGTVTAGTWVWQEKPTKYTVIYHYNDGTENTNTEKYVAAEDATLSSTYPARFNKTVTSWNTAEDGTGTSYELGATIPANTYAIGAVVNLYAIWEDNTSFTNVSEGVYQFQIPGNAQIKLDGIPAGTVYRVSEMLPNGWILVNQSNSSGSIGPLTNSVSTFINKYMPQSASAAIYATKTMDGAPATEDMAFEFTLKEGENVIQTVTAANGAVLFDPIIYTSAGTHVYTIVENWETYSGPLDASGVTFDTHVETVTVEVTDEGEGKLSAEVTYDADGPAFANRTNPGDLIITKNVVGQTAANADDTFTFTIRIKSPTGGDINSASVEIGKLPTAEQSPEPTP